MQRVGPQRAAKVQAAKVLRESSLDLQGDIDEDGSYALMFTSSQVCRGTLLLMPKAVTHSVELRICMLGVRQNTRYGVYNILPVSNALLQGRPKHRRGSGGSHLRTDVSPSGRERSEEEEQAIINAIKDENTRCCAMKCALQHLFNFAPAFCAARAAPKPATHARDLISGHEPVPACAGMRSDCCCSRPTSSADGRYCLHCVMQAFQEPHRSPQVQEAQAGHPGSTSTGCEVFVV